jgi:hybrid polyketide synthase / nonribosomal peptide synthetase ACE1
MVGLWGSLRKAVSHPLRSLIFSNTSASSPNHAAQTQLIRDCYLRAGLDLSNPADRPQFFECHGTGTLVGDKTEAQAISAVFFPAKENSKSEPFQRLVVGSIKTVIGHTEGAAGLAGVVKASLALQNATIPPNLLFNRLNPGILPFYDNLHVSTELSPWPNTLPGQPRRASVNR